MTQITEDMLTDWFPPDVKPVHRGVYEIDNVIGTDDRFYSYWDGGRWGFNEYTVDDARKAQIAAARMYSWRGLKEPHNGEAA